MAFKKIIFIVGPTAVGKTNISLSLAKKINAEIISCDSMLVYKEVSIATCKPSRKFFKETPHHLIDIVLISQNFNVSDFNRKACYAIQQIHKKKKIPLIVGGSGLYMSILLDGIFEGTIRDERIRKDLEREAIKKGDGFLHKKLLAVDPQAAERIHPNDIKRIIRALEVLVVEKKPISQLQKNREGLWGRSDIQAFCLNRERDELYERINQRVDQMFALGLIEEIRGLLNKEWSQTAQSIIGFKEVKGFLEGKYDLQRTKYLIKLHTRHYAKRQLTWFRKEKRLKWLMLKEDDSTAKIVSRLIKEIEIKE